MKLTIDRSDLLRGLGHIQAIVERRGTLPILSNVLICATDAGLTLSATGMIMIMAAFRAQRPCSSATKEAQMPGAKW